MREGGTFKFGEQEIHAVLGQVYGHAYGEQD
jgi:hypothetical protein